MERSHGNPVPNANVLANSPPPFLSKTYDMVDDSSTDAIVSWSSSNNSFVVWNPPEFARGLLPKYFKHNNFSSFVRQLNTYGFRKVDPDRWEFANEGFLRGQRHLLKGINRRKPTHVHGQSQQSQGQSASTGACVEVGNFGVEEEIERLKRDKNVLMQELVRLRQQQQSTDHQIQTMGQRLQGMEQRQQQMMSFLAKAMQSPGFLAQLVQQNDSNRHIGEVNKKRRLPKQEDSSEGESASSDGQIIKYQPLMNEAAKAMLMEILKKIESPPRLETTYNADSFLIENTPSPSRSLDNGNSSVITSGVTLAEVPHPSGHSCLTTTLEFQATHPSTPLSELQPAAPVTDMAAVQLPDTSVPSESCVPEAIQQSEAELSIHEFSGMQVMPENNAALPIESFTAAEAAEMFLDSLAGVDEEFSPGNADMDVLFDSDWERFLSENMLPRETEETDPIIKESSEAKDTDGHTADKNGWDKIQRMDHLTEQMGLLTSES